MAVLIVLAEIHEPPLLQTFLRSGNHHPEVAELTVALGGELLPQPRLLTSLRAVSEIKAGIIHQVPEVGHAYGLICELLPLRFDKPTPSRAFGVRLLVELGQVFEEAGYPDVIQNAADHLDPRLEHAEAQFVTRLRLASGQP